MTETQERELELLEEAEAENNLRDAGKARLKFLREMKAKMLPGPPENKAILFPRETKAA